MRALAVFAAALLAAAAATAAAQDRSFTIDYEHDTFLKDGKPFRCGLLLYIDIIAKRR